VSSRSYRGRIIVNCLAYVGATATVLQVADWVFNLNKPSVTRFVGVLLAVGLLWVFFRSAPRQSVTFAHAHTHARITIATGDLLGTYGHPAVITTNRNLDTAYEWVPDSSLVGQLAARWYGPGAEGRAKMATAISAATGEEPHTEHLPGFVAAIEHDDQRMLLLTVSSRHPDMRSSVLVDDIWTALSGLWAQLRRDHCPPVSVPIIGSGYAGAKVGVIPLLMLLLISYVTATAEARVGELRIVLPPKGVNPAVFEVTKTYCESMGFREI
jgi:hypothetical protein